jgi:uncharacterized protein DUF2779
MTVEPKISKTQFIKGLQCPKALWYYIKRKDLKPEIDLSTQARFDAGKEIGIIAQQYFEGGIEVTEDYWEIEKAVQTTHELINKGCEVIYEATAIHPVDGSYCRIDILRKIPSSNQWDLIEVKSSTEVKDYHFNDMSFQYYVFSHAGFKIRKCFIMHINNEYVREGDIDPYGLLKLEDISEQVVSNQENIEPILAQLSYVLEQNDEPDEGIGSRCYAPFECDYMHHCWKHVPDYSIYKVYSVTMADEIYSQIGSYDVKDIPSDSFPGGVKGIDVDCYQKNTEYVEEDSIEAFLSDLEYPLYYLDYETLWTGIPLYDGTRPYQQIPFQFSLHVQGNFDAELQHFEFLHKEPTDPRPDFTERLIPLCGDKGSIVVYNKTFEMTRNRDLAKEYPGYAAELEAINGRIVDLMEPFRYRWLYKPEQMGSYKIKNVLPAYVQELSYKDLEIGDGADASESYFRFVKGVLSEDEQNSLWPNLSEYCKLDTYAMVALIEALRKLVK